MPAYSSQSFEEEKAAIIKKCNDLKEGGAGQAMEVFRLEDELRRAASPEVLQDEDVAFACVGVSGVLLKSFSDELRAQRDLVLSAVTNQGYALLFSGEEFRQDKEVVLAAVSRDGLALDYASEVLRADPEVVMAAVSSQGKALEFASEELRRDREVVLAAVSNNGVALEFASTELQTDRGVVLAAIEHEGDALLYASRELTDDKAFLLLAARCAKWSTPVCDWYSKAGPSTKEALSAEEFCLAVNSRLAVPGQPQPAPTLLVSLTRAAPESTEHGGDDGFHVKATLGLSGEELAFDLPAKSRADEPVVKDLAKDLSMQLYVAGKLNAWNDSIYINILNGDDLHVVTPWDCQRPLSQFLPAEP